MGLVTPPFAAAKTPAGFGNEMGVQFDQAATEVAIVTNNGVQIFRRRRLVDVFAAALRESNTEEDFENTIKKFVRLYGRTETCACAVAVACGQGIDVGADSAIGTITDPNVIELARRTFVEHGGKPDVHEVLDGSQSQIDNVRPSPRAEGLILYTSRLVRSVWKSPVIAEGKTPTGGLLIKSTVPVAKLQEVSRALTNLREFLEVNKTSITGLTGPEEMNRVSSINEQVALQAEHRVLDAQVRTILNTIEGIAFLTQLFEQPVDEIFLSLPDGARQRFKQLSF
jgi:nuclear pore complex protein Nup155